jgi:hypothetical protein
MPHLFGGQAESHESKDKTAMMTWGGKETGKSPPRERGGWA